MGMFQSKTGMMKSSLEDKIVDTVIFTVMTFVLIITLYPFYYIVILSFNEGLDATRGGIYLWPRAFTFDNYIQFLSDAKWVNAIFVTVAKTSIGTVLCIFFTSMVAYGLSEPKLLYRKIYTTILLVCMYFSGGLIPYYLVLRSIGLINTFAVYVIPGMFSIYYCILAISFFREIPKELHESATLDGAGDLKIFTKIILPLSKPLLATLALFAAVGLWNNWSDTAFFAPGNKSLRTLAYLMRDVILKNQVDVSAIKGSMQASRARSVTSQSVQMSAMIIAVLPIVTVYPFIQKYFVKGIMLGAVKG